MMLATLAGTLLSSIIGNNSNVALSGNDTEGLEDKWYNKFEEAVQGRKAREAKRRDALIDDNLFGSESEPLF
jgi:hypothetical protein